MSGIKVVLFCLPNCLSGCALSSVAVRTAAVLGGSAGLSNRETRPAPELSTGDAALLGAALAGPRADLSVKQPAVGRGGHGGRSSRSSCRSSWSSGEVGVAEVVGSVVV